MKLFRSKKELWMTENQERLAGRIADRVTRVQRRLADYLNGRTWAMSSETWKLLLIVLCLVMGGYSLYLVIGAFN